MNIYKQLESTHSKENSLRIVQYIEKDAVLFAELMDCFFAQTPDYRVPQRAAYTVSLGFQKSPELILPYRKKLIDLLLDKNLKSSLKRNILRILQFTEIEENERGKLYDACSEFLMNPKEEIAIRAFSISVLYQLSQFHKEFKPELKLMIETVLEEPKVSPGIKSRGVKIWKKLNVETN